MRLPSLLTTSLLAQTQQKSLEKDGGANKKFIVKAQFTTRQKLLEK